ncbi:MAG: hypothetical protein LBK60_01380, partial [Verrucomicrobiales bacterium]|nr:hypothetical protein [Verrucomicrobiales bacterium]
RRFKNYLAKKEDLNFHGNFSHKTCHWCARASYGSLWDSIYGPGSAAKNPWVWVYQFEVLEVKK